MVVSASAFTIRCITDEQAFDALGPAWERLHASVPGASSYTAYVWMRAWWRAYGATYGNGRLCVLTAWRGDDLAAVLPLYESRRARGGIRLRCLRFLSTGEDLHEESCPDYLDLLARPDDAEPAAAAMRAEIDRLPWDCLEWLDLADASILLREPFLPAGAETVASGSCAVADLTDGFEAYLGRLTLKHRGEVRKVLRDAEKAGAHFDICGPDQAESAFDDLCRLHQSRWESQGEAGVFAAPRFVAFHRELVREWLPSGRAMLARVSVGGETLVVLYGYVAGDVFYGYQSGVRVAADGPLKSPGTMAHALLMRELAARGITAYDFHRGSSFYKNRLATRETAIAGLRVWRRTPRALAFRGLQYAARRWRARRPAPPDGAGA